MKRIAVILLTFVILLFSGCRDSYKYYEDYPEFFSIAIYTLLGVTGGDGDEIEILEKDTKGRTLFSFSTIDNPTNSDKSGLYSIMICQKTDSKYAYYYPDYNFITAPTREDISEEEILELKARNDWEKELDESKIIKVKIVRKREKENSRDSRKFEIFKNKVNFDNEEINMFSLGKDKNNRWLYYAIVQDREKHKYKRSYMLILNKDFSYQDSYIQQAEDIWNYQDQLKRFKEINNWVLDAD